MSTPPTPASENGELHGEAGGTGPDAPDQRVGALRGATVQVDGRLLARIGLWIAIATLAVLVVAFTLVGVHKNQQTDQLHDHGVPVTFVISGCRGLLGGSGSNAAGYSCDGAYVIGGHRYSEPLPGTTLYQPGAKVRALAVPGDPALVSPLDVIDGQHSSASVYVLPLILLVALVLLLVAVFAVRRRHDAATEGKATGG